MSANTITPQASTEASSLAVIREMLSLTARASATLCVLYTAILVPFLLAARAAHESGNADGALAFRALAALAGVPVLLGAGVLQALAFADQRDETILDSVRHSASRVGQSLCLILLVVVACGACLVPLFLVEATLHAESDPTASALSPIFFLVALACGISVLVCAGPVIGAFYRENLGPIDAAMTGFELSRGRRLQVGLVVLAAITAVLGVSLALAPIVRLVPWSGEPVALLRGALAYVFVCAASATTYRLVSGAAGLPAAPAELRPASRETS